jgi:GT2 family glycosyltransferase
MNSVALIVLNWNGINDTLACLDSLLVQSYSEFKIIIVDNGSIDDSVLQLTKYAKKNRSRVHLICNPVNLGFAGGVNTGIYWAIKNNYPYVALFNNDAIADSRWLEKLVSVIQKKDIGIATGLLLHRDGKTIDSTGDWYSKWGLPFPRNRGNETVFANKDGLVFGASGGATLYKTSMFNDIGLFDNDFFAYYEDVDISFRAQLAGWKVVYSSQAIAYHKQGATSRKIPGFTTYQTFKNLPLVYIKDVPKDLLLVIGMRFWVAYGLIFLNAITHKSGWPALRGFSAFLVLLPKKLKERHTIQKKNKVTTEYIQSILWNDLPPDQTGLRKLRNIFTKNN